MKSNGQNAFYSNDPSPLLGSSLCNIIRLITRHHVERQFLSRLLPAFLITPATFPYRCIDHLYDWLRIYARPDPLKPPVFIIGHWRSGTTHLHNLLCQDSRFGYVTTYQSVFPDLLHSKWLFKNLMQNMLHEKRPGDNVNMNADYPQEDEFALSNLTLYNYYHFFYFPSESDYFYNRYVRFAGSPTIEGNWKKIYRHLILKTAHNSGGRQLVLKNPVNTARVKTLMELFPEARFIFIHRHPVEVYASTRKFFLLLIPALQLQSISESDIIQLILRRYEILMTDYVLQRQLIPENQLIEIAYNDLESKPLMLLENIYDALLLDGFSDARYRFEQYIGKSRGYQKNKHTITQGEFDQVAVRWKFAMQTWNYTGPGNISIKE